MSPVVGLKVTQSFLLLKGPVYWGSLAVQSRGAQLHLSFRLPSSTGSGTESSCSRSCVGQVPNPHTTKLLPSHLSPLLKETNHLMIGDFFYPPLTHLYL